MSYETGLERSVRWIMNLDRMIHEPSRLAILTILRHDRADYLSLQRITGLSKGNLSNHLAKLEKAELVAVGKHFEGKTPVTTPELTGRGRARIEAYWTAMMSIAAQDYDPAFTTENSAQGAARVGRFDSRETSPYR